MIIRSGSLILDMVPYLHLLTRRLVLPLAAILILSCASHPTPGLHRMSKGEVEYGWSLALENILPYGWARWATSDYTTLGFRLGLPVYGTGVDLSRILYARENKWDMMDIAWSLNPNKNIDFTYYKFYQRDFRGKTGTFWWAFRGMYIPTGISGNTSTRIGFLLGTWPGGKVGYELGYFHDFNSMPLLQLFNPRWRWDDPKNIARYGDTPHIDPASGLPSEFSRLTGLSLQVFFRIGNRTLSNR
ncbi:MAG: hypothetical protein D6762_07730 [Candidatus Neomarinimicrobiota bacterium]|nr:MAG: hypothetical protein D6762_07730 [Candidatus Neomarinimicrobiota bacterium]